MHDHISLECFFLCVDLSELHEGHRAQPQQTCSWTEGSGVPRGHGLPEAFGKWAGIPEDEGNGGNGLLCCHDNWPHAQDVPNWCEEVVVVVFEDTLTPTKCIFLFQEIILMTKCLVLLATDNDGNDDQGWQHNLCSLHLHGQWVLPPHSHWCASESWTIWYLYPWHQGRTEDFPWYGTYLSQLPVGFSVSVNTAGQ